MANTYYDSQLTAEEIEAALEAIDGVIVPANNGKVLAINNGKLEARSVQWGGGEPTIEPLSITVNGTYTAPSGVDGYSPITVNVSGGGGEFVVDEYSRFLVDVFDTESPIESGNTIEVAFYANSYVNDGHIVGQSYNLSGDAYHLTTYSNKWYVGGVGEANFPADSDCPLSGADIVYKAKTGEIRMNGVVKTTSFTMPNQPSYTYKLNTRGGSVSTNGVYKYKYVKVYDSNNNLICHWEFGHIQVGTVIVYVAHEKVRNIYKSYDGNATVIQPLSVTQNGTYNPPSGVDGYAPVTVNVSGSNIETAFVFRWIFQQATTCWGIMKKLTGNVIGQNGDNANTSISLVGDLMTVTFHGTRQSVEVLATTAIKLKAYRTSRTLGPATMTEYTMAANDQQSFTQDNVYGGIYFEAEAV